MPLKDYYKCSKLLIDNKSGEIMDDHPFSFNILYFNFYKNICLSQLGKIIDLKNLKRWNFLFFLF